MTEREAKEVLNDFNRCVKAKADGAYETNDFLDAKEVAIKALEKQTAEKVIVWADNTEHCPYCEKDLTALGYLKHCNDCGQKLDWSEV